MSNTENLRFVYNKEILDRSSKPGFEKKIENPEKNIDESVNHIQGICDDFISFFKNEHVDSKIYQNSKLKLASSLFDIKSNQIRIKCALLSWNTIYNNLFSKN